MKIVKGLGIHWNPDNFQGLTWDLPDKFPSNSEDICMYCIYRCDHMCTMCWWSVLDLCSFLCSKTQHCDAIQTITMFVHITPENCLLNPRYPRVPQTFCTYYCKYYRPAFLDQGRQFVNAMVLVGGTRHKWSWQLMFRFNKDCRWTEANPFMAGSIQSAAVTTSCIMLWYCRIPLKLLQGLSSMLQPWRESQYVFTVLIHFGHLNSSLQFAS